MTHFNTSGITNLIAKDNVKNDCNRDPVLVPAPGNKCWWDRVAELLESPVGLHGHWSGQRSSPCVAPTVEAESQLHVAACVENEPSLCLRSSSGLQRGARTQTSPREGNAQGAWSAVHTIWRRISVAVLGYGGGAQ